MEKEKSICFSLKRVNHIVERGIHTSLAAAGFDEITNMHGWILGLFVSRAATWSSQKDNRIKFWNCPFNGDKYPAADGEKGVSDKDYR